MKVRPAHDEPGTTPKRSIAKHGHHPFLSCPQAQSTETIIVIPVGSGEGIKPQAVMQNGKSSGRVKTSAWDGSKATQALRKRSNTMLLA